MQVISDDETGLLLWQPAGSDFAKLIDADGNTHTRSPRPDARPEADRPVHHG